jgi:hypothetical protein
MQRDARVGRRGSRVHLVEARRIGFVVFQELGGRAAALADELVELRRLKIKVTFWCW